MFLGYYKFFVKSFIKQSILKFLLRSKGVNVSHGCVISSGKNIAIGVYLGPNSKIGANVVLKKNVRVGANANLMNITVGENSAIETGVMCTGYGKGKIVIGKESYIGIYDVLDWSDDIIIGNYVHIAGPSTGLWTHSSAKQSLAGLPLMEKDVNFRPTAPIVIEDNVYIGGNCTIYPGVKIHHHVIVAPNSVVTKDVEPYTMVGGVPAKIIKKL
jgi:acetyltransferase-like isoleucine patch superfamily enzyme